MSFEDQSETRSSNQAIRFTSHTKIDHWNVFDQRDFEYAIWFEEAREKLAILIVDRTQDGPSKNHWQGNAINCMGLWDAPCGVYHMVDGTLYELWKSIFGGSHPILTWRSSLHGRRWGSSFGADDVDQHRWIPLITIVNKLFWLFVPS